MTGTTSAANGAGLAEREAFVAAFTQGWRAPGNADSFADHFDEWMTEDIRLVQPQVPTTSGRAAFREQFARPILTLIPDLHADVHRWAPTADGVLIEFTLEGTLGGRPVSWPCIDRITLRDGLACERRAYFDPLPLLGAIAKRPRTWPRFARLQLGQIRNRFGRN